VRRCVRAAWKRPAIRKAEGAAQAAPFAFWRAVRAAGARRGEGGRTGPGLKAAARAPIGRIGSWFGAARREGP